LKRPSYLPLDLLRHRPGLVLRFIAGSLGRAALTSATILLIHQFLAAVLGQPGGWVSALMNRAGITLSLSSAIVMLALVQLGAVALAYDSRVSEHRILTVVELGTMERVISHILGLSVDFFDDRTHGELVQSVRQDVTNLRIVTAAHMTLLLEATQALGLIAVATRLSPSLALWAFLLVPVAAIPITIAARRTLLGSATLRRRNASIFDMLLQLVHGIRIIKIYESEAHEAARTSERARGYFDQADAMERTRALARVALDSMSGVNMIVVAVAGGLQVLRGTLGWPELLAFFLAARAAQGPLNNMNTAWMEMRKHAASVHNIQDMLRTAPTVRDAPDARPLSAVPGTLTAHDLTFVRDGRPILDGVTFSVRAGETLGIVGPSGAGKTTLLNLVARFHDPASGSITIDGIDLRALRLSDVHANMAIVTQDPFLFSTTIADNIARGRPSAAHDEIEAAARAAEIHDDIVAMPEGYATVVGHGGRTLSRGEAQRINIARAVLKNAPILLLDEATSSLDSWSETRVQKALDRLVAGRMVLSVAHRLSTLRNAARILVLDGGRAVGLSSHEELLATCETYKRLWFAQAQATTAVSEVRG
jgi:ABC-type multidrug transport system fused ATPase/permease subunit